MRRRGALRAIKCGFLLLGFVVPVVLLAAGIATGATAWPALRSSCSTPGSLAERWFFLAQANHPQNLYYQAIA